VFEGVAEDADVGEDALVSEDGNESAEDDDRAPIVWIHARYEVSYRLPDAFEASEEELESFAATNGIFNCWPYFREFVDSCSSRMNLPPIVLPLFRVPRSSAGDQEATRSAET
jgi:hypothetical protein